MGHIFFELTVIICLAAVLVVIFRILKQPLILAYILTGILIGPLGLFHMGSSEVLQTMGELGITLLLFILGLELRFSEIRSIGKVALGVGFLQMVGTFLIGYCLSLLLGYAPTPSVYIGLALMFSSTIIVVKLLGDKKDLSSLYGKITVGILLAQDFMAIFTLIILAGFQNKTFASGISLYPFLLVFLKAFLLFALVYYLSRSIFPRIIDAVSRSAEALFLVSLGIAFGMAGLVSSPYIGFSIEIGGFLAGLALANSQANFQIVARVRALRDTTRMPGWSRLVDLSVGVGWISNCGWELFRSRCLNSRLKRGCSLPTRAAALEPLCHATPPSSCLKVSDNKPSQPY